MTPTMLFTPDEPDTPGITHSDGVVLVVDDHLTGRIILSDLVGAAGYRVVTAASGAECLQIVDEVVPDVILLDVMMPGLDGFEVCRRLKRNARTALIPVVLVTALDGRNQRLEGLRAGADDFLNKPVDDAELIIRIRSSVTRSRLQQQLHTTEAVLETISSAIELKDGTTGHHCRRLVESAATFGRFLDLSEPDIEVLRWAGHLHDVGKVGVPDAVLTKQGPLTAEEWDVMRRHTELGEDLLRPLAHLEPVLPIVRHHHEWWNGAGYPDRLAGNEIPLLARVFQLVDAYDALVSERPYKGAMSGAAALEIMASESGHRFDPLLFDAFREAVDTGAVAIPEPPSLLHLAS